MRRESCARALAILGVFALHCPGVSAEPNLQPRSGVQVDVGIFYEGLAPHGDWVEMQDYGWSWAPRVERDWRPYTRGQWVMTDDGWYWDSDEEFGWAAYHYGRWVDDPYYGWVWVPGTEWAPAWVSWRHGNGYTGWAPLPPRAAWRTRVGLSIGGLDIDAFIGARDYTFVPDRSFVDRGVYQRVLPPDQNLTIISVTKNVTNYTVVNDRVFNGGVSVSVVERALGRRVPRARTVEVDRWNAPRRGRADEVAVFRPEVRGAPGRRPAQGRSLVKGEKAPSRLLVRRQEREKERKQRGPEREVTALDVQRRQRPAGPARVEPPTEARQKPQTPRPEAKARPREAEPRRDEPRAGADRARRDEDKAPRTQARPREAQPRPQVDAPRERPRPVADKKRGKDQEPPSAKAEAAPPQKGQGGKEGKANKKKGGKE